MALVLDPATGRYIDNGVPAVPVDPNPAALVVNGDNPARAAQMQAQLTQPVTGPRGIVGAPPVAPVTAGLPNAADTALNNTLPQIAGGVLQAGAGALAAVPALGLDAVNRGLTSLAGGDPNTLPGGPTGFSDAANGAIAQGTGAVGNAFSTIGNSLQAGLRQSLGVQPAAAPVAPVAPAPVAAPVIPSAAAPEASSAVGAPPTQNIAPLDVASLQAGVNAGLPTPTTAPLVTGPLAPLGGPVTNGIGGGFGTDAGGNQLGATQYLDKMRGIDAQHYNQQQQIYGQLAVQQGQSRLDDARDDPIRYRQLLAEQRLLTSGVAQNNAQGASSAAAAAGQANALALAGINNTAAAQRTLATNAAELAKATQVANLTGSYGLQGAQVKATAINNKTLAVLNGPAAQLATANAARLNEATAVARAKYDASAKTPADQAAYIADLKTAQLPKPAVAPYGVDLSNVPFTAQSLGVAQAIQAKQLRDTAVKAGLPIPQ